MRVCKHGCGAKLFCFSRANHASTNLKKVLELKSRQVYFIYPFLRRLKLGKSLQRRCVNFFSLQPTFYARKVRILESMFLQNKNDYACKTSWTRLCDWQEFLCQSVPYKEFCVFSPESHFIKAIENFFPEFAQPDINTRGVGRILEGYANPRLRLGFA